MALATFSSAGDKSPDQSIFDKFLKDDNIKGVEDTLGSVSKKTADTEQLYKEFDHFLELKFDKDWAQKPENKQFILDNKDNPQKIADKFTQDEKERFTTRIQELKEHEIIQTVEGFRVELNQLSLNILKDQVQTTKQTNTQATQPTNTQRKEPQEFWIKEKPTPTKTQNKPREYNEFIDKESKRAYQALSPIKWNNIDTNNNQKVNKRELKKAGIVDRYRQSNKDVQKAVQTLLNRSDKQFKKNTIKNINWQDLTTILEDIMQEYYTQTHSRDSKDFKQYFKENFVQTNRYNPKGIKSADDIRTIQNILEQGLEDQTVQAALQHLADIGPKAKNINTIGASNDLQLLTKGKVDTNNIFHFLCDFDSNGIVDSTAINKQRPNHSRRDTGSVMGLQLYQNFAMLADLDTDNNIVDGNQTAQLIKSIISGARSKTSNNSPIQYAIDEYSKRETNKGKKGFSRASFIDFMSGEGEYSTYTIAGKETKVAGVSSIKSYIESLAQESNEGSSDVTDIFSNAQDRKETIANNAEQGIDISRIYDVIDTSLEKRKHNYGEADIAYTRRTIADKVLQTVNYLTDTLFVNLDTDGKLANIFYGEATPSAIGKIQQRFYFPDGTRNQQKIKNELGNYINTKIMPTFGIALDKTGNPIVGVGVGTNSLSKDLTKRFSFSLNIGATLPAFNRANKQQPQDLRLGINIDIEKTRQTKNSKENTKQQNTKNLVPTTRVGLSIGAGFEFITQQIYVKAGPTRERDFPAGIEQKGREFDAILKTLLIPTEHEYRNSQEYAESLKKAIKEKAETNNSIANNQQFLYDMADALANKMEWAGIFALLNSPEYSGNNNKKTALLNYFYNQYIDGFHENAINQDLYNQLAGQGIKLTKINIGAIVGTSVAAIALAPVTGGLSLASIGLAGFGSTRFSTFRNSFSPDAYKTANNYEKVQTYKNMQAHQEYDTLDQAAKDLEKKLNILEPNKQNIIKVTANQEQGTFKIGLNDAGMQDRNISAQTILSYINVYYAPDSVDDFRFENGELIIGQTQVHIGRIIQKDRVEFHVMIGNNSDKMTKLTGPLTQTDKQLTGYQKPAQSPARLDEEKVKNLVDALQLPKEEKESLEKYIQQQREMIPTMTRGAIQVTKKLDGRYTMSYIADETKNKLTLNYKVVKEEAKEQWQETMTKTNTIDIKNIFDYKETTTDSYEILRNQLNTLGKTYPKELFETANKANNQSPNLLVAFLKPLQQGAYQEASTALLKILKNNNIQAYSPFVQKLENPQLAENERILLCNKYRQLLAYNATSIKLMTGQGRSNINTLGGLIQKRNPAYQTLANKENIPFMYTTAGKYYKQLQDMTKTWTNYTLQDAPNIIGYTAFYRTQEKHFGMTHPGETKIISHEGQQAIVTIDKKDQAETSAWYIQQIKKNPKEFALIQETINNKLKEAKSSYRINTIDDLQNIINNKKITYTTKDSTWKEVLTFDGNFVLYLMGECSNESLGFQRNKIQSKQYEKTKTEIYDTDKTKTATIQPGYTTGRYKTNWKSGIYNNEYDIQTRQRDLTLAGAMKIPLKVKPPIDGASPGGQDVPDDGGTPGGENPPRDGGNPGGENPPGDEGGNGGNPDGENGP